MFQSAFDDTRRRCGNGSSAVPFLTVPPATLFVVICFACVAQQMRTKVKSSGEVDFSNAIGGTKKVKGSQL